MRIALIIWSLERGGGTQGVMGSHGALLGVLGWDINLMPALYLHGLSTGDFDLALRGLRYIPRRLGWCISRRRIAEGPYRVERLWLKWLRRRSQRGRLNWDHASRLLARYPLPPARIVHSYLKRAAKPLSEEPDALVAHVRI